MMWATPGTGKSACATEETKNAKIEFGVFRVPLVGLAVERLAALPGGKRGDDSD
jgi:hypothetical protein